jgi:serine/threonine-protein kinase
VIGGSIAHYRVTAKLGAGGMGEVYRATDSKLGRDVALKVLPQAFTADAQRMARFQREAQVLASLNHPHIAAIYGIEEGKVAASFNSPESADESQLKLAPTALVMELVEGPTLAERIAQGAIPFDEALPFAKQIAEALEYAHEKGIVHRDLKPANIKLTRDGQVKVLDFGLAKALQEDPAAQDVSNSPTLSVAATQAGFILGTAAYMSPEQARGKSADRRADVWSFGVVLYEMLTGARAFAGEDISITLANVIKENPDWLALPADTPRRIRELLRRCLAKDPRQRLQAIGEARIALEEPFTEAAQQASPTTLAVSLHAARREKLAWGMAATLLLTAGVLAWTAFRGGSSGPLPVRRSVIALPESEVLPQVSLSPMMALSPDGTNLVFMASRRNQGTGWQLYLRPLDQMEARPLEGTEDAQNPFFSPDGKWIGFFGGGKLRKIPFQGGAATAICDAFNVRGATWGRGDTIIFSQGVGTGLLRVSAAGGIPQPLTTVNSAKGDSNHRWPHLLPDGRALLFSSMNSTAADDTVIEVLSLETGQRRVLVDHATAPQYASSGHIIFYRGSSLFAVPFDARRLEVTGAAVPVVENVWGLVTSAVAHFSLAGDGTLVYAPGGVQARASRLALADRKGATQLLQVPSQGFANPALSADGQRVAITVQGTDTNVWIFDIVRGAAARLTFQPVEDESPAWTPDGRKVAFSSDSDKGRALIWKNADGSGSEEILWVGGTHTHLGSFSRDGRFLAFVDYDSTTQGDIWVLPLQGDRKAIKFIGTSFNERSPAFSPDGRWLAFTSDDSGHDEVYVVPFPGPGGKWQISTAGGGYGPVWARNGRELFYRHENKMMAVAVASQPSFSAGVPRQLFESMFEAVPRREANYDVTPDGQRFLVIVSPEISTARTQLMLVTNWFEELKRLAPLR